MPVKNKYTSSLKGGWIRIFINGVLHLLVKQNSISAIKTYVENKNWYRVLIYTPDGTILLEYDEYDKFKSIVNLIDEMIK